MLRTNPNLSSMATILTHKNVLCLVMMLTMTLASCLVYPSSSSSSSMPQEAVREPDTDIRTRGPGTISASLRREWPELLFRPEFEAAFAVHNPFAGNVPSQYRVFLQSPFEEADANDVTPKYDGDDDPDDNDVWIYTTSDIDGIVYEIPRRGRWHPNRIDPGWTDLVGVEYKAAIKIIQQDMTGVLVEYKPADSLPPDNFRINRVILYVNPDGNVDRTPKVG